MIGVGEPRDHLRELGGEPRPAGSPAEARARGYCAGKLRELGFSIHEQAFLYSAVPGRLATPGTGVIAIALLAAAAHEGAEGRPAGALAILAAGAAVLGATTLWLIRRGVLALPLWRRSGVNLVAVRGEAVRVWVVAHLDSKSQPIPIAVRGVAISAMLAIWVGAAALALLEWVWQPIGGVWAGVASLGVLAGLPIVASVVGSRSSGAVDNASGVAAALTVAELVPRDRPLGVLLTGAEELGLAGSRAWVRHARGGIDGQGGSVQPGVAINLDGLDDYGPVRITYSGLAAPRRLVQAIYAAAIEERIPALVRRLPPGVLVDSIPFAEMGWSAVTLSKGGWATIRRVHTPADDLAHLHGDGVVEVAHLVIRSLDRIG